MYVIIVNDKCDVIGCKYGLFLSVIINELI